MTGFNREHTRLIMRCTQLLTDEGFGRLAQLAHSHGVQHFNKPMVTLLSEHLLQEVGGGRRVGVTAIILLENKRRNHVP